MIEKTLRAVCYNRVSTLEETQLNAIESQIEESKNAVASNGWALVDTYVDRGKSGTQVKYRDEYQRLYDDMLTDKFDVICIKDQDRLMRSTKDWYLFVDRLVTSNKRLYMYLDNSWYTPDNSLITGIKAIMAEEFSRNLSKKINNSRQNRIEKAKRGEDFTVIDNGLSYGYAYDTATKTYSIIEEQAEIIKEIYKLYLNGYGARNIRRIINDQYPHAKGKQGKPLDEGSIRKILKSERYKGTLVMGKTHYDFEKKKKIQNPQSEWTYIDGIIPAIVSAEIWEAVQKQMKERTFPDPDNHRGCNTGKSPLSGKIVCGECGKKYWHRAKPKGGVVWKCSTLENEGRKTTKRQNHKDLGLRDPDKGCDSTNLNQEEIEEILEAVGNELSINRSKVKADMLSWLNNLLATLTNNYC